VFLGLASLLYTAQASFAVSIVNAIANNPGPLKMKLTILSTGNAYKVTGSPSGGGPDDGFPNEAAAAANVDLRGITSAVKNPKIPGEETWGVFDVTQLLTDVGHPLGTNIVLWSKGNNDEELTGIFYGGHDVFVSGDSKEIDTAFETAEFYLEVIPGLSGNPALAEFGQATLSGTAGRSAVNAYASTSDPTKSVTDGTLFWKVESRSGVHPNNGVAGDNGGSFAHRHDDLTTVTPPFAGTGGGFYDITGGVYAFLVQPAALPTFIPGVFRSHRVDFTLRPVDIPPNTDWDAAGEDPIRFRGTPEPSTVVLVGIGLLSLAACIRKRRAK
jgi:hypothetical protein